MPSDQIALRVPKSMRPEEVVWAFRYGVAWGRYHFDQDGGPIRRHGLGYVAGPRSVLRLADRVSREYIRRHREEGESDGE